MASRVSEVAVEATVSATSENARVSEVASEALSLGTSAKARVGESVVEILWLQFQHSEDSFGVDAYVFSPTPGEFTIDAEVSLVNRKRFFTVGAVTWRPGKQNRSFTIGAVIAARKFMANAFVRPYFRIDAFKSKAFKADAYIAWHFRVNAVIKKSSNQRIFALNALIARGSFTINANILRPSFTINAEIQETIYDSYGWGMPDGSGMPVNAFITPTFAIDAYILGVPTIQFDDSGNAYGVGSISRGVSVKVTIAVRHPELFDSVAANYWYSAVCKMQTYVNRYQRITSLTAAQKEAYKKDLYTLDVDKRRYRQATECPVEWIDYTPHCLWSETTFTQQAKVSPGTFQISLRGAFPELKGGEEIRLEINGLRVFGGYVSRVDQSYFFDYVATPKTILSGFDYNVLFDKLVVYNRPWTWENYYLKKSNGGEYQNWQYFAKGTMDRKIIVDTAKNFVDIPFGMDYGTYVDAVDTPAPVSKWMMPEPGSAWRTVMQSVSQITSAVWWIDQNLMLQYHDRYALTPNRPSVTDGAGGISSRDLLVTSDINQMITDEIVWGTLAATVEGKTVWFREQADGLQAVRFWTNAVNKMAKYVSTLRSILNRTDEQEEDYQTDLKTLAYDKKMLQKAKEAVTPSLIDYYGRWQNAEFRADFHHIDYVTRRAQSIVSRYSKPIVMASASIYEAGYTAGQVVNVKSNEYGVSENLVIRSMTISFEVSRGSLNGVSYAVPKYDLVMGLEPEEPWNIYDYLPFEGFNVSGG